ncbi:MAG: hypothetical protein IPL38_08410 [Rhodobacter sp.]|nr:hypothetical protein [Rhodobacter sp.]MBK8439524.1 hypothetical protein [Rhodobacter sp.]
MRALIIKSLDLLVWLLAILIALAGLVIGFMALGQGQVLPGLGMIVGGVLYAVVFAGMFFILIGIHDNTKRTADAVERMTPR